MCACYSLLLVFSGGVVLFVVPHYGFASAF